MRLAVIAHDAGGANVLAALARFHQRDFEWSILAAGPAHDILARVFPGTAAIVADANADLLASLLTALAPDAVLTSTGWQTRLERNGVEAARRLGVPVASILDHWVNFRERFGYPGDWLAQLPDRVLVGDSYALEQAQADGFPAERLGTLENPYLADFARRAGQICADATFRGDVRKVLFLGEPLAVDFAGGPTISQGEPDVAATVVDMVLAQPDTRLVVRAHPSESLSRYAFLRRHPETDRVELHGAMDRTLEQDIAVADVVVGMSSMALLAAAAAGCSVIAYTPEGLSESLPHRGIRRCKTSGEFFGALSVAVTRAEPLDLRLFSTPLSEAMQALCADVNRAHGQV
jgi:hypothetical protein